MNIRNMSVGMEEVTNYCRLCGEQKEPLSYIFREKSLSQDILQYLQVQIYEEDSLPHGICTTCGSRMKDTLDFVNKCQNAQRKLCRMFTNTTSKISACNAIKTETEPKGFDFIDFEENSDFKYYQKILFTKTVPERPATADGGPNVTICITDSSDSNQLKDLYAMSKPILKKFGEILYDKYFLPLDLKENMIFLDFLEVADDLNRFRESLDPLSLQENRTNNATEKSVSVSNHSNYMDVDGYPVPPRSVSVSNHSNHMAVDVYPAPPRSLSMSNHSNHMDLDGYPVPPVTTVIPMTPVTSLPVQTEPLQLTAYPRRPVANLASTCNGFTRTDEPSLRCHLCPFDTHQRFRLNQHLKEVHDKPYACDVCDKRFGKDSKLALHKKAEHTDLAPITCPLCGLIFLQKYSYRLHLNKHSNNGSMWTCDHCPESFAHQHKLEVHVARCHKSKSVNCPICAYVAAHKYQIKQHMREVHLKPIICAICGKRESKKCRMAAHIKSKHMEKTTYECEVCTTKYTSKKWFDSHQRKGCPGALPAAKIIQ